MHARTEDYTYCEDMVRRDDPDRWLASLFIEQPFRKHAYALYAFNLEIARAREVVTEPILGEIRFQWWRDILEPPEGEDNKIESETQGHVMANPVAAAVLDTIERFALPRERFIGMIEARTFDLYDAPMRTLAELESYGLSTAGSLFYLVASVLSGPETPGLLAAAEPAGLAYGLTGLMRALPWHSARGQDYVPCEMLSRHKADLEEIIGGIASPGVFATLAEMRGLARQQISLFEQRIAAVPLKARAAFLPVCFTSPYLKQMDKRGYAPFRVPIMLPQWRKQWILWRASKRLRGV
ncbi:phytoene/squalene synthase family protein [Beijerinckia indica]|uniref:Squalene/phytoene synthase n=1 Tax=Beijerinckia indica subsp. indica (strain ATCC 9039 / DSM 1715 / NCIMB 8712) TaxID=395963 RepID=B2II64_BEII9|nr:phytoene/squalene synthase family protein [Beijerinckia indica]ACB94647.1 squalene/phytoene synthase [Beijerinckia indica subsp. indica ATCC 9039]